MFSFTGGFLCAVDVVPYWGNHSELLAAVSEMVPHVGILHVLKPNTWDRPVEMVS